MEAQIAQFLNRGMNQDISVSKASNEFAFRNHNIRITAVNDNTLLSVTNEKGNREVTASIYIQGEYLNSIKGTYLGHAILNDYIVIFTSDADYDYIYRLTYVENSEAADTIAGKVLFKGDLGFDENTSIDTLAYYESDNIQKVYWVDENNQPRFINIMDDFTDNPTKFDFFPTVESFPIVEVKKEYNGNGLFPSGVIQYFISYYNKYGAETGLVWSSDLQYITQPFRGESPEDTVACSFKVNVSNIDTSYDYIRLYSLIRTSLNNTPQAKLVADVNINESSSLVFTDNNTTGEAIDPSLLLFVGGSKFKASTLAQKDGTLFFGNVSVENVEIPAEISSALDETILSSAGIQTASRVSFSHKEIPIDLLSKYQLGNSEDSVKTFKRGEIYRFSVQFQDNTGSWTSPKWIGDRKCNKSPEILGNYIKLPVITVNFGTSIVDLLDKYGYINYRILIAETNFSTRSIIAQGIVTPTVFNFVERVNRTGPFSIASWIARPRSGSVVDSNVSYEHLSGLGNERNINLNTCEIQNSINKDCIPSNQDISSGYIVSFNLNYNGWLQIFIIRVDITGDSVVNLSVTHCKSVAYQYSEVVPHSSITEENIYNEIINFINENLETTNYNGLDYTAWKDYIYASFFESGIDGDYNYTDCTVIKDTTSWASGFFRVGNYGFEKSKNIYSSSNSIVGAYTYLETNKNIENIISRYINNFYVDSSIVNFYSPDIEDNESILNNIDLKFRIVGTAPISLSTSDVQLETSTPGIKNNSSLVKYLWDNTKNKTLVNAPMYQDYGWTKDGTLNRGNTVNYYLYMWNKGGSLVGQTSNSKDSDIEPFNSTYAELKHKIFATHRQSYNTEYFSDSTEYLVKPIVFNSDAIESKVLPLSNNDEIYQGNYENVIATPSGEEDESYRVFWKNSYSDEYDDFSEIEQYDPIHIKYRTSPHAVFELKSSSTQKCILPRFSSESGWYSPKTSGDAYPWFKNDTSIEYIQYDVSSSNRPTKPYLFVGEVYRDLDYNTLYGGLDENSIERLNWIPVSKACPINEVLVSSSGDTYYQKWDCLISCPTTESDLNSVVDITSFMVETHINLDGRYDKNKDLISVLNVRKENFNKINSVYNQANNFFTYNILDSKFKDNKFKTQVLFSLQKTPLSDIDSWTNIPMTSALNVEGLYGNINKIINFNDTLILFQDKAISAINYNNRTALSVEAGVPIEIANSGKVNGYTVISSAVGCKNNKSICQTSSGVYFTDDYNKALFRFNKEGLNNLSATGMSKWFKDNLSGDEYIYYDAITHDVYLINPSKCLIYNEDLQAFTSFMDYQGTDILFNLKGNSFTLYNGKFYKMFDGNYNIIHNNPVNYYVEYKINPEPLIDKVFGNIEYLADCIPSATTIDENPGLNHSNLPFDRFDAWNEYQSGSTTITERRKYPNFEKKFRVWRADFPRDNIFKRDRMRNPWIYIRLSKNNSKELEDGTVEVNKDKTVFHSLAVKYYK